MEKYKQKNVEILGLEMPVIHYRKKRYYPIRFIEEKVLLRKGKSFKTRLPKDKIIKIKVDFDLKGVSNIQLTNCVREDVLIELLKGTQIKRLDAEQRERQNELHRMLGLPELSVEEFDTDYYKEEWAYNHEELSKETILTYLQNNPDTKGRMCTKCFLRYPLSIEFFELAYTNEDELTSACKLCRGNNKAIVLNDKYERYLRDVIKDQGRLSKAIQYYRNNSVIKLYEMYNSKEINRYPEGFDTKDNLIKIITHLMKKRIINEKSLTASKLSELRIALQKFEGMQMHELYTRLFGDDFYYYMWKYPKYSFREPHNLTLDIVKINFKNCVKEFNIEIADPINFDYDKIIRKCHLTGVYNDIGGVCGFFVSYWEGKYAGYQFRNIGNYYRINRENVLNDLRFLIEKDLQLKLEKIPLYLTKTRIRQVAPPLYNYISNNSSIFELVNELYPNQFEEMDFDITQYRDEFDSVEEGQVDDVLRECLPNVVYNRNDRNCVTLKGKRPDWFVFTEKGVWVIEYLGMYIEQQRKNPIVSSYIETTHEKMKLYDEMNGYKFIYLYPRDLENNFFGVREKIREIG